MNEPISAFCAMVRHRSEENKCAMQIMASHYDIPLSPAFSLLRQELDSMVRIIFLLSKDKCEREKYIVDLLNGERWKVQTSPGKERYVLDKDMIDLAQTLQGWTKSVYKFGCAFIHLSEYHNYFHSDPVLKLSNDELQDIAAHLSWYHGYNQKEELTLEAIKIYIPMIFNKINENLECYIKDLETGRTLDNDDWISDLKSQ